MAADFRIMRASCWTVALLCLQLANAFYIPGWSIKSYSDGEPIPLMVNKVYSDNTQIQYAFAELPFVCPPSGRSRPGTGLISGSNVALNLGEILRGDRIVVSDYELQMGQDDEAHYLCSQKVDRAGLKKAIEVVKQGYVAEWIVDNLPGATSFVTVDKSRKYYAAGFKMGYEEPSPTTGQPRYFLNNHVTLVIRYHRAPGKAGQQGKKVIVGFEVYAKSLSAENRDHSGLPPDLHDVSHGLELTMARNLTNTTTSYDSSYYLTEYDDGAPDATLTIPYSYSVYFREEEKIEWANRWDLFFVNQEESQKVHWLAIVNSIVISGLLTAVVAVILTRTVKGDIRGYLDGSGAGYLEDGGLLKGGAGKKRGGGAGWRTPRKVSGEKNRGGLLDQVDMPGSGAVTPTTTTADELASDDDLPLAPSLDDISGWKLLHADVFRPPPLAHLLAPLIGSGTQLVTMALALLCLSCLGILNPSYRGGFLTTAFICFLLASVTSGYFSARLYRTFGGARWRHNALVTATLFPGLLFATVFVLNLFVWARASSTAIPLGTLVVLLACWLFVQVPLVYLGAWVGFDEDGVSSSSSSAASSSAAGLKSLTTRFRIPRGPYTHPLPPAAPSSHHPPPRPLPPTSRQPWFARPLPAALVAGLIPFAVIFIELLFVFRSLWQDKSGYYYVFGFLAVVCLVLVGVVMEVSVIGVYGLLCCENYNWWWHSFLLGASSALWIFAYCLYYAANHLHLVGWPSSLLFFAYSFLACAVYALLMGTVGFLTAYAFVRRIYWAIKVD
ncbi:putative multispanning membrane protein [Hortaea werneckii]|nr:putative multispanning membrane protein [Hortaea werneckii]KAI7503911.1 putative multispanning membrane protein [Hortaea werneckii]